MISMCITVRMIRSWLDLLVKYSFHFFYLFFLLIFSLFQDPFGLRLDIVNRLLYWTDSELQIISVSDLEGRQRATIISTDLDKPGAIITEPNQG